jgi:succinate dehydrogenase/fumarate reductase flavoprotein subunit
MVDVIVVGSGAAGLSTAVAAAVQGADVLVLEASDALGGTSCFSGGGMWIPNNRFMREEGIPDSREDVLGYVRQVVTHQGLDELIEAFVDHCNPMLDFYEAHTKIRFQKALGHPDYRPELEGSREHGRCISPPLFDTNLLGDLKPLLRRTWNYSATTADETYEMHLTGRMHFDLPHLMDQRREAGLVGNGTALVGYLLEGCVEHGVEVRVNARAVELLKDGGRVEGVVVEREDGAREELRCARGVVLACGGFEWNEELVDRFLAVPMVAPASPGHNRGDGVTMAMKAGAGLANMTEAWWNMLYSIPGEQYEGRQLSRPTSDVRGKPGMIVVNRTGRRFANESLNYHDLGKAMRVFDPGRYEYVNAPAYIVLDAECRATYRIHDSGPEDPDPAFMMKGETLAELAAAAGIDAPALERQVEEFNRHAAEGRDPVFHRGENAYDRHMGDALKSGPEMCLRPLGPGPYYAVEVQLGCFGTKGGPMTDRNGQVLDPDNRPIEGLFAVGNTAAHVFGDAYPGGGSTLGPALTFGYLAGHAIAGRPLAGLATIQTS